MPSAPARAPVRTSGESPLASPLPRRAARHVSLSEVLSALSRALDLTEGQPAGHTLGACLIAMRLADQVGLGVDDRTSLYYALLLKDAGCSSNAARMAALFGSPDQDAKRGMKLPDWDRRLSLALHTARNAGIGRPLRERVRHFLEIARTPDVTRDLIRIRCDRGAAVVAGLGFPAAAAEAVRALDEHWNGGGYPDGRRGDEIPILSRIALLAQTVEIFHRTFGRAAALRMARERRGTWFDPALVDAVLAWAGDGAWWLSLSSPELEQRVVAAEPGSQPRVLDDAGLDAVCASFAEIIDAKSPFTYRHSANVAAYADGTAGVMGRGAGVQRRLRRAGLLHDVGKLGVSSRTLDKQGPLDPEERRLMERHPAFSWEVLSRVGAFQDFAWTAALHHEKLDGSGYPWGFGAAELDDDARVLVVADIYEALTADRPYRAGMTPDAAFAILARDAGTRLCARAVDGLREWLRAGGGPTVPTGA
ncbi:MAG TPA: HD domain-containing phosphohydrolase [Longimicrobiaceae bacterium]|nr:HD domain-containing phosphohydrolase [Longimicrobiaceae bacterium]